MEISKMKLSKSGEKLSKALRRVKIYIGIVLIAIVFIWWFKLCVDNWNKEAAKHNEQMKKECPCGKWHYVSKGYWECDCPK